MQNPYQKNLSQYKTLELQSSVENASPHELINLLLQGARSHINAAKMHIEAQRIKEKGENISKAISILDGLINCLNHETGGDIAENLRALYQYTQQILLRANLDNNTELLDEANILLTEVHEAWRSIKDVSTEQA